jgi:hypothetical protein
MWVKVEGDYYYSAWEDSIIDNTGTGGSSSSFFEAVLEGIGLVLNAWQIYEWVSKVYQTPLVAEWQEGAHWSKAISRQGHWEIVPPTFVPYLDDDDPHLQTACANVLGYFTEGGSNILDITAGAEIYVQWADIINGGVVQRYIGTYSVSFTVPIEPVCAMKTKTDGYFYVPNVATDLLKIEMLFDNQDITGDQTGGSSPYDSISHYPDGYVNYLDSTFVGSKYGLQEGDVGWDYMADIQPNKIINFLDAILIGGNYGKSGTYITDPTGVTITFNTGQEITPDAFGFVSIPIGATSFTVKRNGSPIGAMIIFW